MNLFPIKMKNLKSSSILTLCSIATLAISCATTPPQYTNLPENSNTSVEIKKTEEMLEEARRNQVDVLSPNNYDKAQAAFKKAVEKKEADRKSEEVLEQIAFSRGWLQEANSKSTIAKVQMKSITDAREGALKAGAPKYFSKEWAQANQELEGVTHSIEKGNLNPSDRKGNKLISKFHDLEVKSVSKEYMGPARENLEKAVRAKADKNAPKTYERTVTKFNEAEKFIAANPRETTRVAQLSREAGKESARLLDIVGKVNQGNSEDLILQTERQRRTISNLKEEYSSTEEELSAVQSQAALAQDQLMKTRTLAEQTQEIRNKFRPNEAEVFTENGKIMIRLKGLHFSSASTRLNPQGEALLARVDAALAGLSPSKIIVEGHTDSIGKSDTNLMLSEARAKTVESYLSSRGYLKTTDMEVIGRGALEPISDNKTPSGRAQNRRIDLVVETL